MSDPAPIDVDRLMVEISEEAARRRRTGELPHEYEQELDRAFAQVSPVDAVDADFDTIMAKIERSAVIDTRAPTVSSRPGVARMKQGVAKVSGFYIRHVASQTTGLIQALARAVRLLSERVETLEASPAARGYGLWLDWKRTVGGRSDSATADWHGLVVDVMNGIPGRVLHGDAGAGDLVVRLIEAGVDAYGVEPIFDSALVASGGAVDIRADDAAEHLRLLPPGSLGGLVLSGCTERLPVTELAQLVDLAASKLVAGAPLVVISAHPAAWASGVSPVAADLAPGHPLHPETWLALLDARRFSSAQIHAGQPTEWLERAPGEGPLIDTVNANVARLNAAMFGSPSYAVTALSPR